MLYIQKCQRSYNTITTMHTFKIHENLDGLSCGMSQIIRNTEYSIRTALPEFIRPFMFVEAAEGGTAIDSEVGMYPPQDPFFHCFSKV